MNAAPADAWIRRYRPADEPATRLICFPHAGGSATFFHPLTTAFGADVDVVSLQYPGRQDRRHEPLVRDAAEYADRITEVVRSMPMLPTVLFGHSMGAVLAFETMRRLEAVSSAPPAVVVVSGRRAPSAERDDNVHLGTDAEILAEIKRLNGTSTALLADDEVVRMSMPAIRGDYTVIETYSCPADHRVECPITVLVGADDPQTTFTEAQSWQRHTTGSFRMRTFPGGHFYLTRHQRAVVDELTTELGRVGGHRPATNADW